MVDMRADTGLNGVLLWERLGDLEELLGWHSIIEKRPSGRSATWSGKRDLKRYGQ